MFALYFFKQILWRPCCGPGAVPSSEKVSEEGLEDK